MPTINVPLTEQDQDIIFLVYPDLKDQDESVMVAAIKQQAMSRPIQKAHQFANDWAARQAESGVPLAELPNPLDKEATLAAFLANEKVEEYEQAVADLAKWNLKINGREAVEEVLEVTDPETGEVTQEYIAPVSGVTPIPTEIESTNEEGQAVMIDNPAYLAAVAARDAAQAVIDNAGLEVLDLVLQRGGS